MTTFYTKNENNRYERAGVQYPHLFPEGLSLVYVHETTGSRLTLSSYQINLDDVQMLGLIKIHQEEATKIVMKALEFEPVKPLTESEQAIWNNFRESPVGQKIVHSLSRKSATDVAKQIIRLLVEAAQNE